MHQEDDNNGIVQRSCKRNGTGVKRVKSDLASTVAAVAAMDDESLDNKADNEKDARIEPFLMYR